MDSVLRAVRCIECGYDLAGLREDGVCPECAAPVSESLVLWGSPAVEGYVRGLRRGIDRVAMSLAPGLLVFAGFLCPEPYSVFAFVVGGALWLIAWCTGWMMVSAAPPGNLARRGRRTRDGLWAVCLLEVCIGSLGVACIILEVFGVYVLEGTGDNAGIGAFVVIGSGLLAVASGALGMLVLGHVAEDVLRDKTLAGWCSSTGRISVALIVLLAPAALVVVPLAMVQMFRVRRGLRRLGA